MLGRVGKINAFGYGLVSNPGYFDSQADQRQQEKNSDGGKTAEGLVGFEDRAVEFHIMMLARIMSVRCMVVLSLQRLDMDPLQAFAGTNQDFLAR